jgi:hypothetical protein
MRLAKAVEAGSDPERLHLENVVEANNKTIQQLRLQLESFHRQPNNKVRFNPIIKVAVMGQKSHAPYFFSLPFMLPIG